MRIFRHQEYGFTLMKHLNSICAECSVSVSKSPHYTDDDASCCCILLFATSEVPSQHVGCFFRDKLRKQNVSKSAEFGLSQLNCSSTTTDGLTATTPSPSTLPWAIIILPPHLTFSPGSHPSCFSPAVSPQSTLLIYFTRPWSHIWTVLSLERQWP